MQNIKEFHKFALMRKKKKKKIIKGILIYKMLNNYLYVLNKTILDISI